MPLSALANLLGDRLHALPLAIVYLTDRCNSRCVMCDYWRHGQTNLSLDRAHALAAEFDRLDTRQVLLSGGEPLLHPQWADVARILSGGRRRLWLLTAGLSLQKHVEAAADLCHNITVSLDGATPETYRAVRGVDTFGAVCAGIRAAVERGALASILRCPPRPRRVPTGSLQRPAILRRLYARWQDSTVFLFPAEKSTDLQKDGFDSSIPEIRASVCPLQWYAMIAMYSLQS